MNLKLRVVDILQLRSVQNIICRLFLVRITFFNEVDLNSSVSNNQSYDLLDHNPSVSSNNRLNLNQSSSTIKIETTYAYSENFWQKKTIRGTEEAEEKRDRQKSIYKTTERKKCGKGKRRNNALMILKDLWKIKNRSVNCEKRSERILV